MESFISSLTSRERELFHALLDREVVSKAELLHVVWGYPEDIAARKNSRAVDVTVMRLRKKMQEHSLAVESVYGVGYRLIAGM